MAGHKIPGPKCQVRQWFADPVDNGTMARIATPSPKSLGAQARRQKLSMSRKVLAIVRRETDRPKLRPPRAKLRSADTVQAKSTLDLHDSRGRIASIYF